VSLIKTIANWLVNLTESEIPQEVKALLVAQRKSVIAAISASSSNDRAKLVANAFLKSSSPGSFKPIGTSQKCSLLDAIYHSCINSIALDFDDYMCFGHTGHSSVVTSLYIGAYTNADPAILTTAQLAANEIAARLGGSCLIGPQNGQLWSFIHSISAAAATSKLLDLDVKRTSNALALALYHPPRATPSGFFNSDAKLLTAAEPTVMGVRAAFLARDNVEGPVSCLDDIDGFYSAFSFVPLKELLETFQEGYLTYTLAIKKYPGCAYIDPVIDAINIMNLDTKASKAISKITIRTNLITYLMDYLSSQHLNLDQVPTPVNINFSLKLSTAIALMDPTLTVKSLNKSWLTKNFTSLKSLFEKTEIIPDQSMTLSMLNEFSKIIKPTKLISRLKPSTITALFLSLLGSNMLPKENLVKRLRFLTPMLAQITKNAAANLANASQKITKRNEGIISMKNIHSFKFRFPSEITIELGSEQKTHFCEVPEGSPKSSVSPDEVADLKFAKYGPLLFDQDSNEIKQHLTEDLDDFYQILKD